MLVNRSIRYALRLITLSVFIREAKRGLFLILFLNKVCSENSERYYARSNVFAERYLSRQTSRSTFVRTRIGPSLVRDKKRKTSIRRESIPSGRCSSTRRRYTIQRS